MASRYESLLADQRVRRWYDDVGRGSPITADVYLKRLGWFSRDTGITPLKLAKLKSRKLYELLLDLVTAQEKQGLSGGSIALSVKALKSWLVFNGVEVRGRIRIRGRYETPTLHDERVPSREELKAILLAGDAKTRAICVLLAHTGVRPAVLGNYQGTDGLRIADLPELQTDNDGVAFHKVPAMVRVRSVLSKKAHEYFSFLGAEGCEYLKAYLECRLRSGETLTPTSAIIRPKSADRKFIKTINISDAVRKALRKAGLAWRPYVLRSYFATQLMVAESNGLVTRDYRSFFMGHKGDIEAVYTLHKRQLPPEVVEQMRSSYAKAQRFLETSPRDPQPQTEYIAEAFKRQLLLVAGLKPDEIAEEQLGLDDESFQKLIRDRLSISGQPRVRQHVVPVADVEARLQEGWEFVSLLPDGKAIIKAQAV